jgi:tetratricopeptide (TPR) repeat protein
MILPGRDPAPLYPLFHVVTEEEPLYLYDGHYGIRVQKKQGVQERGYVYYLGTQYRAEDTAACDRLKELLEARRISFFLTKEQTAPWTIANNALDYSQRTLGELLGTKYFPSCYLPREDLERHFQRFLQVDDPQTWSRDTTRPSYKNGLVLVAQGGAGKTALLARQVEHLLAAPDDELDRENPNLVLYLRGSSVAVRPNGMDLFRDMAEILGLATGAAAAKASRSSGGFSNFRELCDHLHRRWKEDRVEGRRLILVLDALNEAPYPATVMEQALEMIATAACFPWCKVIVSTRQEWLGIWSAKMEAQETSRFEQLRRWLYVDDSSEEQEHFRGPPALTVEPFTEQQAERVYRRYQNAAWDKGERQAEYRIPACRTAWEELPPSTRKLLSNPLYLHLFMEAFDGRRAEEVVTVPALFQQYVERSLAEHPGLRSCVDAVTAHLLSDLKRSSADLSDDDCNEIRLCWKERQTGEEARLLLNPVEGLAHEGLIAKRIREEGGGYRFVFQSVAEYLIYRYLATARPAEEDEVGYWRRRARPRQVFAEYAGAFNFLFREWVPSSRFRLAGSVVEQASPWLGDVLTAFLIEQARVGHAPGKQGSMADHACSALCETGGGRSAHALQGAAYQLCDTRFAPTATRYYEACVQIRENLWKENLGNVDVGDQLSGALVGLGMSLRTAGRTREAESACRRGVEIRESLWRADPKRVEVANGLARALNNLALLLSDRGLTQEAESAYRRGVEIYQARWRDNPTNPEIGDGLGRALNNLGNLLSEAGRSQEAESVYRRSVEIYQSLGETDPENMEIGNSLARSLNNLGLALHASGRKQEAETAYRQSVTICDALCRTNPENVVVADSLATVMNNLAVLLGSAGRMEEAESAYRRSEEVCEALWQANPDNVRAAAALAGALNNLGLWLSDVGQTGEAESVFRRSVEICAALWQAHPKIVRIGSQLAGALNHLGLLLNDAGRAQEAEPVFRRSVEISESLWESHPENAPIGGELGRAHNNLGNLLRDAGRTREAEAAYRRCVQIYEKLWQVNPGDVELGDGLGRGLNNLGNVLSEEGRTKEADSFYLRGVEIREALWRADPEDLGIKLGFAASLCGVGRFAQAERLVDEVLAVVPQQPYANRLKEYLLSLR